MLLNFIKDIVHATRLEKEDGTASKQMKWHESSKRMLAALKKFGGPRSFRLVRLNFAAPSESTVKRCWNRDLFRYPVGLPREVPMGKQMSPADEVFVHLASLLKPKVALLELREGEKLPCQFSQDETPITSELSYSQHRDAALGSCGWQGAEHVCCDHFHIVLGDDDTTAGKIEQLCDDAVRATYMRLCKMKPLSKKLPSLVVSLSPSCNRFYTVHVQQHWVQLDELFNKHIAPLGFTRSTHASDGDGRYFAAMKVNMTGDPTWASGEATSHWVDPHKHATHFRIEHEGFTLRGLLLSDGTITNIEVQDCPHVIKKLASWLFVGRTLQRGTSIATSTHLIHVFERFHVHKHKMEKAHVYRHDRQDTAGPTRFSGTGTRDCLKAMQVNYVSDYDGSQHPAEDTQGTIDYLELISNVIRIHHSPSLPNVMRIEIASDVINDLRFWRNHLHHTPGFTLKEHFMSRQSFEHCTMECHSVCLHIKMFGVQCPSQPTDLDETGSDDCEKTFSSFGGHGKIGGRRKDYTFCEALDGAGDENQLAAWADDSDAELRLEYGSAHRKHGRFDMTLHEPAGLLRADLTIHPTSGEQVAAFERGLVSARARAVARGMDLKGKLSGSKYTGEQLMAKPWLGEGNLVSLMRNKADDEAEAEAAGDGDGGGGDDGGDGGDGSGGAGDGAAAAAVGVDATGAAGDQSSDDGEGIVIDEDTSSPPPPPGTSPSVDVDERPERAAAAEILETVLGLDADHSQCVVKRSPMLTVKRGERKVRVYKRTYLHETQQLGKGNRLPGSRLEKIKAAAEQTASMVKSTRVEQQVGGLDGDGDADSGPSLAMLGLGCNVALATELHGRSEWWAGRVQQMFRKSGGKTGKYVPTTDAIDFDEAVEAKVKVVCKWYSKHDGYEFTYDGPVDTQQYSMENVLGLLPLTLPDDSGRLRLRDPAQGPMLDEAQSLTQPSKKAGSKRTQGEEVIAEKAKRARQTAPPGGQVQQRPQEVARAPGKRRATHRPGMR